MYKHCFTFVFFLVVLCSCSATRESKSSQPTPVPQTTRTEIKPLFNAAGLAGMTPGQVEKFLGKKATDAWEPDDGESGMWMQTFSIGQEMTVEYKGNSIRSFVIFFADGFGGQNVHRLVGLDSTKPYPKGISTASTGPDFIKVFYTQAKR